MYRYKMSLFKKKTREFIPEVNVLNVHLNLVTHYIYNKYLWFYGKFYVNTPKLNSPLSI